MGFLASLKSKLREYKFGYYGLKVIQGVPCERFHMIIALYVERGWELSGEYNEPSAGVEKWACKLRKGTSTLLCEWNEEAAGGFIGPERVLFGLGQEFGFSVKNS